MEQTRNFLPVVSTVCSNCKHCRIVPIDGCFCIFECRCVMTKDPVDGHVTYKDCKNARTLINGDWNIDCTWYEQRLSALQKVKRFFKRLTKTTDPFLEEPASDDLVKAAKNYSDNITDKIGYNLQLRRAVVYGAEWWKQQMMKDYVNGIMDCDDDNEWIEITDKLIVTPSNAGKRVKIIIVKEEQQ